MKKSLLSFFILICVLLSLSACSIPSSSSNSTFSIHFIDVGQGDAALIQCDGRYMLIDGGDESAGDKVYSVLNDKKIQHLDILAISHFHKDHVGGLIKVLSYASSIDKIIANSEKDESAIFEKLERQIAINGSSITVPKYGDKFSLGSAEIEVVDVSDVENNDSLVLLITYGKNRFLFTGDIEGKAQKRLTDNLSQNSKVKNGILKVDLIKMPHHGAYNDDSGFPSNNLNRLFTLTKPDYAVISVGNNNMYGHPHIETLKLLDQADVKVYRTDQNGDIIVQSDGKNLSIKIGKN